MSLSVLYFNLQESVSMVVCVTMIHIFLIFVSSLAHNPSHVNSITICSRSKRCKCLYTLFTMTVCVESRFLSEPFTPYTLYEMRGFQKRCWKMPLGTSLPWDSPACLQQAVIARKCTLKQLSHCLAILKVSDDEVCLYCGRKIFIN
jgi:hypothetical protein